VFGARIKEKSLSENLYIGKRIETDTDDVLIKHEKLPSFLFEDERAFGHRSLHDQEVLIFSGRRLPILSSSPLGLKTGTFYMDRCAT
jgi:hypothetical protein